MTFVNAPTTGARLELSLEGQSKDEFVYEVALLWPAGEGTGRARVSLPEGKVDLSVDGAPDWLLRTTTSFLRGLARDAREGQALPRRVARWRDVPTAG